MAKLNPYEKDVYLKLKKHFEEVGHNCACNDYDLPKHEDTYCLITAAIRYNHGGVVEKTPETTKSPDPRLLSEYEEYIDALDSLDRQWNSNSETITWYDWWLWEYLSNKLLEQD